MDVKEAIPKSNSNGYERYICLCKKLIFWRNQIFNFMVSKDKDEITVVY